jgi:hypothetical protein
MRPTGKALFALALLALFAAPAAAQAPNINLMPELKSKTPEEKERDEQADRAYRESLRKIPDAKGASDPWGTVRSTDAAKPVAKPKPTPPKRAKADVPAN